MATDKNELLPIPDKKKGGGDGVSKRSKGHQNIKGVSTGIGNSGVGPNDDAIELDSFGNVKTKKSTPPKE